MRKALMLSIGGVLIAWFAMLSYFFIVPRWPALRDSGLPNVALGAVGVLVCLLGQRRSFALRRLRVTSGILTLLGLLPAALLTWYIFWLSYQMPSSTDALAVGDTAPAFQLPDQTGKERTLEEFAGSKVVLVFYRGPW